MCFLLHDKYNLIVRSCLGRLFAIGIGWFLKFIPIQHCLFGISCADSPEKLHMQKLSMPYLQGWSSIHQLVWCLPGLQHFDPTHSLSKQSKMLPKTMGITWVTGLDVKPVMVLSVFLVEWMRTKIAPVMVLKGFSILGITLQEDYHVIFIIFFWMDVHTNVIRVFGRTGNICIYSKSVHPTIHQKLPDKHRSLVFWVIKIEFQCAEISTTLTTWDIDWYV